MGGGDNDEQAEEESLTTEKTAITADSVVAAHTETETHHSLDSIGA
jgi:hypothetical protein